MLYVEADLARRPTPAMVADGAEWFRRFRPDVFGVEANQFQDLLAGEFEAEFRRQGILAARPMPIENHTLEAGPHPPAGAVSLVARLRFKSNSPGTRLLVEQLQDVPHRRPRRRSRRAGNGVAIGHRSLQRPRDQRRPGQPVAGGMREGNCCSFATPCRPNPSLIQTTESGNMVMRILLALSAPRGPTK